jgi:putative flippase GtrA
MNNLEVRGRDSQRRATYTPPHRYDIPRRLPQLWRALLTGGARPLRFALIGALCAGVQLALLFVMIQLGIRPLAGNIVAYLLSAQANFFLSDRFIWHDRRSGCSPERLVRRWLSFHVSIAGTFALNQAVFVVARIAMPDLAAAAAGIGVSALANFVIQDRLTFR